MESRPQQVRGVCTEARARRNRAWDSLEYDDRTLASDHICGGEFREERGGLGYGSCENRKLDGYDSAEDRRLSHIDFKTYRIATFDLPGWVPLGFDLNRIRTADQFQKECKNPVGPILAMSEKMTLPEGSYRSGGDKSGKKDKFKKNP